MDVAEPEIRRPPTRPGADEVLQTLTWRIVEACDPERVILFGSRAWGSPRRDSDYDVFVIAASDEPILTRTARLRAAVHPRVASLDLLVRTPQEVAQRLAMGDFFVRQIIEKGRVLYDRQSSGR
jgi:predicted nucleotidyltransferase